MTLAIRYAARSDVGLLREGNEDSGYAGPHLLMVADGMGGQAHGEVASAVAVTTLASLDEDVPGSDLLEALQSAVHEANTTLHQMVQEDASLESMGTTLVAMLWSGSKVGLCHIGDSRGYLLRGGDLYQITHDHTLVQHLVDEGRITADEAATHPQRSLILRALDGRGEAEPDLSVREAQAGDRYLLCSDGLSAVVTAETLLRTLSTVPDLDDVCHVLIDLANRGGGPDNITCVVADVVDAASARLSDAPLVVGAAANATRRSQPANQDTPAGRAHTLTRANVEEDEPQEDDGYDDDEPPRRRRWPWAFGIVVVLLALCGLGYGGWRYTQGQYYIGASGTEVVIYRGMNQDVAGLKLSKVYQRTGIELRELPSYERQQVRDTTSPGSLTEAHSIVGRLKHEADRCGKAHQHTPSPAPTRSGHQRGHKHGATPKPSPTNTTPPGCPGAPA